ncbi:glycosyltransferase family 2 protein [Streptococcus suis]|nr:glycosyltransferase family 2 protein [Streptococcus suis]
METPLISVIVPIYNVENYLRQCLDSIIGQTYQNLEILLIDDASTDRSVTICHEYQARDNRIRLIQKTENRGVSDSRNLGLKNMTGDFVTFVDSDDYLESNFIDDLYSQLTLHDADIVIGEYYGFDEDSGVYYIHSQEITTEILTIEKYFSNLLTIGTVTFLTIWGKLFRSQVFTSKEQNIHIRFPNVRAAEDRYIIHQLILNSRKTVYYSKNFYCYRKRQGSLSDKPPSPTTTMSDIKSYEALIIDMLLAGIDPTQALACYKQRLIYFKEKYIKYNLTHTETYYYLLQKLNINR